MKAAVQSVIGTMIAVALLHGVAFAQATATSRSRPRSANS